MMGRKKQKPRRAPGQYDTLISSRTSITGDVRFSGGLHVDGKIAGEVRAEDNADAVVRISEVGEVHGNITAPHVIINGKVHGDVYAGQHLELAENASVTGNVHYRVIQVAMGAQVNGQMLFQAEEIKEGSPASADEKQGSELVDKAGDRRKGPPREDDEKLSAKAEGPKASGSKAELQTS